MKYTRSAGGIVISPEGGVLVINQHGASWSLPKGHVEGDETLLDAARREIYEESGIMDLELVMDLGHYERFRLGEDGLEDVSELKTIFIFLFRTRTVLLQPLDVENPRIAPLIHLLNLYKIAARIIQLRYCYRTHLSWLHCKCNAKRF